MARIFQAKGDFDKALEFFYKDLNICQEIGDIHGMAITLFNIGALKFDQELLEEAIPFLYKAYQIFIKIGSPSHEAVESYLNAIFEKIGEQRFKEILNNLDQNP